MNNGQHQQSTTTSTIDNMNNRQHQQSTTSTIDNINMETKKSWGTRHFVALMLFLGMAMAYIMRTNMSVAIVAMVNHTAFRQNSNSQVVAKNDCPSNNYTELHHEPGGSFEWSPSLQGYIISSFFCGYVITQIPIGLMSKKFGALRFLGYGMLMNSVFAFLVPVATDYGVIWLCVVRFIQGLGEGPIVPCTHALLAKWVPTNERSRMGAFAYAGAQFGTIISMPLSGLLAEYCGWPSIFYVFGVFSVMWSVAFLWLIYEDPSSHPNMNQHEKSYILQSLWGTANVSSPPVPYKAISTSLPFYAILLAHMGQNYGYETLMTELPTYMKQVLKFSLKENGLLSALPYLAMCFCSMFISFIADWMTSSKRFTHTATRKIFNSIGQYGPAVCLIIAAYTGCNRAVTVAVLTIGMGLNGGIYSGFKINHLDIAPRFAATLMSFTNCTANLAGLLAPITAGHLIEGDPSMSQWKIVFFICAGVYVFCASFYNIFGSGVRQPWENPSNDAPDPKSLELNNLN